MPGTSQAVRSKPDFGGSARTLVPYWATRSSLISSLVLPWAISWRMKARSRSAWGEKERLRAVPQTGHITSSSTSGRFVCACGGVPGIALVASAAAGRSERRGDRERGECAAQPGPHCFALPLMKGTTLASR